MSEIAYTETDSASTPRDLVFLHVPGPLLRDRSLTPTERQVMALVLSLGSTERGCYASNAWIGRQLAVSQWQVSRAFHRLEDRRLVDRTTPNGTRTFRPTDLAREQFLGTAAHRPSAPPPPLAESARPAAASGKSARAVPAPLAESLPPAPAPAPESLREAQEIANPTPVQHTEKQLRQQSSTERTLADYLGEERARKAMELPGAEDPALVAGVIRAAQRRRQRDPNYLKGPGLVLAALKRPDLYSDLRWQPKPVRVLVTYGRGEEPPAGSRPAARLA